MAPRGNPAPFTSPLNMLHCLLTKFKSTSDRGREKERPEPQTAPSPSLHPITSGRVPQSLLCLALQGDGDAGRDSPRTHTLALGEHVEAIPVELQLGPQEVLQLLELPALGKLMEVKVYHRRVTGVARSPEQLLKGERERVAGDQGGRTVAANLWRLQSGWSNPPLTTVHGSALWRMVDQVVCQP